MRLAYLTNRYPAVSHSFIRREIEAIEAEGADVERFSVRPADPTGLPDLRDRAELDKTVVLLDAGLPRLLAGLLGTVAASPRIGTAAIRIAFAGAGWNVGNLVRRVAYLAEAALLARRIGRKGGRLAIAGARPEVRRVLLAQEGLHPPGVRYLAAVSELHTAA